jgi:hypothetical protein
MGASKAEGKLHLDFRGPVLESVCTLYTRLAANAGNAGCHYAAQEAPERIIAAMAWGFSAPKPPTFGLSEAFQRAVYIVVAFHIVWRVAASFIERTWPSSFQRGHFARDALRWENAARVTSVLHAVVTVCLAIECLWRQLQAEGVLVYDKVNNASQHAGENAFLQWGCPVSLAYFAHDSVYILLDYFYLPGPPASPKRRDGTAPDPDKTAVFARPKRLQTTFLVHHAACIAYIVLCLWVGRGLQTLCAAIILGEITNPLQNLWFFCRDIGADVAYNLLTHVYAASWIAVRCFFCPIWSAHIVWFLLTAESAFSVPAARTMAFICICVNIGGFVWTDGLIKKYKRFLKRQKLQ